MCTGSRPSTSSTRTSRICLRQSCRASCSSSNTVGSVRTGMRALAALAHDPRTRRPGRGGDRDDDFVGLGLVEDARQVAFGVAAHAHAVDAQAVACAGSSSRKPTGARPSSRLRMISRSTMRPPSPAPTISTLRSPLPAAEGSQRTALIHAARDRAHAHQEHQRQQREQHDHAVGQTDRNGVQAHVAADRATPSIGT